MEAADLKGLSFSVACLCFLCYADPASPQQVVSSNWSSAHKILTNKEPEQQNPDRCAVQAYTANHIRHEMLRNELQVSQEVAKMVVARRLKKERNKMPSASDWLAASRGVLSANYALRRQGHRSACSRNQTMCRSKRIEIMFINTESTWNPRLPLPYRDCHGSFMTSLTAYLSVSAAQHSKYGDL